MTRSLYLLEPSKVGVQHVLMLDGYVRALGSSSAIRDRYRVEIAVSPSTLQNLSTSALRQVAVRRVFVMNPEKRRLFLKSLVEFAVTLRAMIRLRDGDLLVVTCLLPTSFILVEMANRLLRRKGIHVVIHGDIEGLFLTPRPPISSIFRWAQIWLDLRSPTSRIDLIALDDFIKRRLIERDPARFREDNIHVIHHPVDPLPDAGRAVESDRVGFLGYRTAAKSFDSYARLAREVPSLHFVAIGGGRVEDLRDGSETRIADKEAYVAEIARCGVACFPFTSGYTCALSASALDALAAGTRIVATDRPFFKALSEYFGSAFVRVVSSLAEMPEALRRMTAEEDPDGRARRVAQVRSSKYGLEQVQRSFERLAGVG